MRRYDEVVQVRRGRVGGVEAPEHFVWRDRMWSVTAVAAQWVESGSWWEHRELQALLGVDEAAASAAASGDVASSLAAVAGERTVWRVEAARGRLGPAGVFDLALDQPDGRWRLLACLD